MTHTPTALVVRTAGTNCDAELVRAFDLAGARVELVHVDQLIAEPTRLDSFDLIGMPGGFSYGDDIASARVLAMKFREHLLDALLAAVARGTPIIGVCNGFQALVQIGLLPGGNAKIKTPHPSPLPAGEGVEQTAALTDNAGGRFIDEWVRVEYPKSHCVWTRDLWQADDPNAGDALRLPIAHGEGRFVADDSTLKHLASNGQVAVRYRDDVNGSAGAVAGICDETGLIFGLMPHPERFAAWEQHPYWTRLDRSLWKLPTPGLTMFTNAVEHVRQQAPAITG